MALRHAGTSITSTFDEFIEPVAKTARMIYDCPHIETSHRLVRLNVGTPTYMRAPGEASGSFALESAMDELAYALAIDPITLRLQNYAEVDAEKKLPWSSKSLKECYRQGAGTLWLVKAQSHSAIDARWQNAHWLGHGNSNLSH